MYQSLLFPDEGYLFISGNVVKNYVFEEEIGDFRQKLIRDIFEEHLKLQFLLN